MLHYIIWTLVLVAKQIFEESEKECDNDGMQIDLSAITLA